jgi:hypothetical protein
MAMKQKVQELTKANQEKDRNLRHLTSNLDHLSEKYDAINHEHKEVKGFIQAAVHNPKLLDTVKAAANRRKRQAEAEESAYEENSDATDEDEDYFNQAPVLYLDKDMVTEGQRAVKLVWRTHKFISNEKQADAFKDAVMDNYGKEELVYYPGETEDQESKPKNKYRETIEFKETIAKLTFQTGMSDKDRRAVEKFRKKFKATYGKGWVSYLNSHRNYANVSELWSLLFTSARTSDLSPMFLDLCIYSKGPKMEFLSSWRKKNGPRCLILTSSWTRS